MERIADTPHPVRGNPLRLARQLRANLDLLPQIRREVEAAFERRQPDIVVADFCAPVAGWVAAERVQAARPSLVWPCDYDQFDFAARIVDRGLGIRVRDLGSPASARALDRLLHDFDSRPLAAMAVAAARYDACAACDAVVRRLARPEKPAAVTSSRVACESDRRGCS